MGQDQYPKSLAEATKVLELHRFDQAFHKKKKKNKNQQPNNHGNDQDNAETDGAKMETSFAQGQKGFTCYCCGSKAHIAPDCSERSSRKRDDWWD